MKQISVGQDSFLDIVANLVGILIILVVLVGAQANSAWNNIEPQGPSKNQISKLESEKEKTDYLLTKLTADNEELEVKIEQEVKLAELAAKRRHKALIAIEIARKELEQKQSSLEQEQRVQFEKVTRLSGLKDQLDSLQKEITALKSVRVKHETIEHFPTPIAKTVFSNEVHFRLSAGKISFVPMDELIADMKTEWSYQAKKLTSAGQLKQTIGPKSGYRLQYELEAFSESTAEGRPKRGVRFKRFMMLPIQDNPGESLAIALQDGSLFLERLSRFSPVKTTVSVWVYPDSYGELNQLKSWLREQQFQIASWPLDFGKHISGGPDGFQSAAQ